MKMSSSFLTNMRSHVRCRVRSPPKPQVSRCFNYVVFTALDLGFGKLLKPAVGSVALRLSHILEEGYVKTRYSRQCLVQRPFTAQFAMR
jgi:hypothetical protein